MTRALALALPYSPFGRQANALPSTVDAPCSPTLRSIQVPSGVRTPTSDFERGISVLAS